MSLDKETKLAIEKIIGKPYDEIIQMDLDQELGYIYDKKGTEVRFPNSLKTMMSRGNPYCATGRIALLDLFKEEVTGLTKDAGRKQKKRRGIFNRA